MEQEKTIIPDWAFEFHGHKCPAMPMGFRAVSAAMKKLGVERATDGELMVLVELGENHCATCFADGVQAAAGCTLGKGNIKKLNYGKWGLLLIDKKNQRAVRVVPKAEAMQKSKESKFMEMRKSGTPASQVPAEIANPLVEFVSGAKDEDILNVGEVEDYGWKDELHTFEGFVCDSCGEMTVESYGHSHEGKKLCQTCHDKATASE